jgi:hypothetical protein
MKYLLYSTVAAALVASCLITLAQANNTLPFSLHVTALDESVKAGAPVRLEVSTTNISQSALTLSKSNPGMEYEFIVLSENGKPVTESAALKRMKDRRRPIVIYRLSNEVLNSGESTRETVVITDYYDLSQPGEYSIQVERQVPEQYGRGIVKSNTVKVTITP